MKKKISRKPVSRSKTEEPPSIQDVATGQAANSTENIYKPEEEKTDLIEPQLQDLMRLQTMVRSKKMRQICRIRVGLRKQRRKTTNLQLKDIGLSSKKTNKVVLLLSFTMRNLC
ncbi:hypothetical protein CsatA_010930 [Cannabis sativa]